MAIYKIFPEKDTTIYSYYPLLNTGRDEILELSNILSYPLLTNNVHSSRILIKFPSDQISDIISNYVSGSTFKSYLKLFLANADSIPLDYTIFCYPLSQSWNMGTGKYGDIPEENNGAGWLYSNSSGSSLWNVTSLSSYSTSSYPSYSIGGGVWYTGSLTLNPVSSQSFNYITNKDLNLDVTNTIKLIYSGSIPNNGFILKKEDNIEFNSNYQFNLKYFSMDTHTIYPPCLEIKWDDYSFNTGSSTQRIISSSDLVVSISNNKTFYEQNSIQKFRINVRDKFPVRTFSTSSVYLNNNYLPLSSYYSVKDLDTNEIIIDFDDNFTKISADSESNYFILYMNGLEPERYYKILIKTIIDNNTFIIDDKFYFKILK